MEQLPQNELPKQFADKPALELVWRGLVISISEGFMTRKAAFDMLRKMDEEQGQEHHIYYLDDFRREEPPDIVA